MNSGPALPLPTSLREQGGVGRSEEGEGTAEEGAHKEDPQSRQSLLVRLSVVSTVQWFY